MRLAAAKLIAVLVALPGSSAESAAPWVMLVETADGSRLVLDDIDENHRFLLGLRPLDVEPGEIAVRPYSKVVMYWGPEVQRLLSSGVTPLEFNRFANQGEQEARLYPLWRGLPVIFSYAGGYYALDANSIAVLTKAGVPLSLRAENSEIVPLALLAFALALGALAFFRRSVRLALP